MHKWVQRPSINEGCSPVGNSLYSSTVTVHSQLRLCRASHSHQVTELHQRARITKDLVTCVRKFGFSFQHRRADRASRKSSSLRAESDASSPRQMPEQHLSRGRSVKSIVFPQTAPRHPLLSSRWMTALGFPFHSPGGAVAACSKQEC